MESRTQSDAQISDKSIQNSTEASNPNTIIEEEEVDKHQFPLLFNWKFWFSHHKKNQKNTEKFGSVLNEIISFDNLETFWRAYNNIIGIDHLPANTDFFLFKDYIKPEWEDIKNKKGGRWIYDIAWDKSKHQFISQHTENVWIKLILALIGNLFEECEYFICGVVLSIRHYNNKICIWTCNKDEKINMKIGELFKKNCELTQNDKIYYQVHLHNPKDGFEPLYSL